MEDYDIDHNLPGNPFKPKMFIEGFSLIEDRQRDITVKIKEISYYSDIGLFTNNTVTFSKPSHDFTSVETNSLSKSEPDLFM